MCFTYTRSEDMIFFSKYENSIWKKLSTLSLNRNLLVLVKNNLVLGINIALTKIVSKGIIILKVRAVNVKLRKPIS